MGSSKFLNFKIENPETICYEREGLIFNHEPFDLVSFQNSYKPKFEEVREIINPKSKRKESKK